MTPSIKTTVTNISRQPYSLVVGSKRVAKLRPKESIVLQYDIFSLSSELGKRSLERDIRKGLISVDTAVVTENSVISISCDKDCNSTMQIKAPENKVTEKQTAEQPNETVKQVAPARINNKNEELVSTEAHVRVANKSSSVMQAVMGAGTVSLDETEQRVQQNPVGFTQVEQVKSSSLFTRSTQNIVNDTADSVFNQEAEEQVAGNEATDDYVIQAEGSEDNPSDSAELTVEQKAEAFIAAEDVNGLLEFLKDVYPTVAFTKAALKKCMSFTDIVAKYNL